MHGAIATGHPLGTAVGRAILDRGGNAYDALLSASAALTVVLPHTNGLGSDFFAVVHDREVRSVNGSGWAASLATPERFRALGHSSIPSTGPLSSFSIPGLVASWTLLADRASLPFHELLAPAVRLAREGFPASPGLARAAAATAAEASRADDDWRRTYDAVRPGEPLRQPALARTLAAIQDDRGHSFYHGAIARAIEQDMVRKGGLLRFADLDGYHPDWTTPLSVRYRGYEVFTTPPNSQGATALLWLNLLGRLDLAGATEEEYLDHLLRTLPVAYGYRARYIGDPVHVRFPPELLDPDHLYRAFRAPPLGGEGRGDTTAFSVTDGTVGISAIQSNYMGFGSGQSVAGTGINLNNRGAYFTLDPSHHNALAPGKRTFHTLMALYARRPGTELLLGTMGGDVQPQTNVQILTRLIDRGVGLQAAIDAPRFAVPASIYRSADLFAEDGLRLRRARPVGNDPDLVGHAHGLRTAGETEVGIDPRGDGGIDPPARRRRGARDR